MSTRSRFTAAAALVAVAAGLLAGAPGLPAAARQPARSPSQAGRTGTHTVTLITGDKVIIGAGRAGRERVTFVPGRTNPSDAIQIVRQNGKTYVIPSAARPQLRKLDPTLFDVTTLVAQKYDDQHLKTLPLIVRYAGRPPTTSLKGAKRDASLESIEATALRADKRTTATFWRELQGSKGVERVWLDRKVKASLDRSVPQIGAPQAWAKGFDGEGVTIGVVDTGVDPTHPDLAGKIVASANFSGAADAVDHFGHGTHVASIAAGTGAAVNGKYKGVAPQAKLVSAKVLDDDGYGYESDVIEGMEWAVGQGAKVVNLSLGTGPTDGTSPADVAVNELTEQSGALFVIAAGNDGPKTVSSPSTADAALSVGAVDRDESLALFSGTGPRKTDGAIKPEITAPGVGIVAAKAAGTELGEPVGDNYVTLSGTSMATPHVAGAAAILAQQHPDWKAAELKAGLMSTAKPNDANTVYEQGAGRVDVAHAVDTAVHASSGKLEFGYVRWPHENPAPATRELAYSNDSDTAVTLDLSVAATDVPATAWTLSAQTLTVPAHGKASVGVTLNLDGLAPAHYGGVLTAKAVGETLRTPVGWYLEPELYEVTVHGFDRAGVPGGSTLAVTDIDDGEWYAEDPFVPFDNGVAKLRIPPGRYSFGSLMFDDPTDATPWQYTLAVEPEVEVKGDTNLVLDARKAKPVKLSVQGTPRLSNRSVSFGYVSAARQPTGFGGYGLVGLEADETNSLFYATPTKPAETSDFEFSVGARQELPPISLDVVGAPEVKLDPRYMPFASRRLNGTSRMPVVDFQPGDSADGAIALIRREAGISPAEQASEAAKAGAKLALMYTEDSPGRLAEWYFWGGEVEPTPNLPIAVTSRAAAAQLKGLLAKGPVQIDTKAVFPATYVYDLAVPVDGRVPDDPSFAVDPKQFAKLDTTFGGPAPQARTSEARAGLTPMGFDHGPWLLPMFPSPSKRIDYVQGGPVRWSQVVLPNNSCPDCYVSMTEEPRTYRAGQREQVRWFHPVATHSLPDNTTSWFEVTRTGTQFSAYVSAFTDQADRTSESDDAQHRLRLYRDGELLADEPYNGIWTEVPEGAATYKLELSSERSFDWWKHSTKLSSAWTFHSEGGAEEKRLPLLLVNYDLPTADPSGQVGAGEVVPVELAIRHQAGAAAPKLKSVAFAQSYDGASWQPVTVVRVGEGKYLALVKHAKSQAGKAVSLRVDATDVEGNRLVQTVTKAYGLR
ncbi:S8 family peptidase [Flindersiella endophytica]